jgi:putative peptidoglycan lipid II flippase
MLFQRGEFDAVSTARTASVLLFYAIGLFAYSGEKMVAAGFFAAQDTRTPVIMGIVSLLINAVLNIALLKPMAESGLALSTSLASFVEFGVLLYFYRKRVTPLPFREIGISFVRILAASAAMGIVCTFTFKACHHFYPGPELTPQLIRVFGSISVSVLAYVAFCFLFRVGEMKEAWTFAKTKSKKA